MESYALAAQDFVKEIQYKEISLDSFSEAEIDAALNTIKKVFPAEPPESIHIFGSQDIVPKIIYICSFLFKDPVQIFQYQVEPGSLYSPIGSVTRVQEFTTVPSSSLSINIGKGGYRDENNLLAAGLIMVSKHSHVYLKRFQEVVECVLAKENAKQRAKAVWHTVLKKHLARSRIVSATTQKISSDGIKRILRKRIVILSPTHLGLAWASVQSSKVTERFTISDFYNCFESIPAQWEFLSYDEKLCDLCPVVKKGAPIFSLYTRTFIDPEGALGMDIPSPCAFSFISAKPIHIKSILRNASDNIDSRCGITNMRLKQLSTGGKMSVAICGSAKDKNARKVEDRTIDNITPYSYDITPSCKYLVNGLCTVQIPREILEHMQNIPDEIKRLKLKGSEG